MIHKLHEFVPPFTLFFFFFYHSFILHRLERRTRPILTPYDGRRRWDSNLCTPACQSPALPLCYGPLSLCVWMLKMPKTQRGNILWRPICETKKLHYLLCQHIHEVGWCGGIGTEGWWHHMTCCMTPAFVPVVSAVCTQASSCRLPEHYLTYTCKS